MSTYGRVVTSNYQDSVRLMRIGESLRAMPGVRSVGVVMGTPANLASLHEVGLGCETVAGATPEDIVLVVDAIDADAANQALDHSETLLAEGTNAGADTIAVFPTTGAALRSAPPNVIGLVSVPGGHAAREARTLLEAGHLVMVFSDNVSLDDERELKELAAANGTALLGPDCGTARLGGVNLGFMNATRPGPVGLVAASGTGAQAVAVALDRAGVGVGHVIGVGGRDLTDDVGAGGLLGGIAALDSDDATEVIVVVAKQIGRVSMVRLLEAISEARTPVVTCLFGEPHAWVTELAGAVHATSLAAAATAAQRIQSAQLSGRRLIDRGVVESKRRSLGRGRSLRGAFAGGTLAYEATQVLRPLLSDVADEAAPGAGHAVVDLGDDRYTRGRPHPMINPTLQADFIREQLDDPSVGIVLFDVVVGHGAHVSPAEVLSKAIMDARRARRDFAAVATVVGTADDPQDVMYQREILADAGVILFEDTAASAFFAGLVVAPQPAPVPVQQIDVSAAAAVVNVGARWFAESLDGQGVQVLHVDWRPSADGDEALADALDLLT